MDTTGNILESWTTPQDIDLPPLNVTVKNKPPFCIYEVFIHGNTLLDRINFVIKIPVMYGLTFLGLTGNTLAYVVLGKELRRSSTSVILRSLAVADNGVLLVYAFEFTLAIYTNTGLFVEGYRFLQYIGKYSGAVVLFVKSTAVYLIVFVTAERYIAVCKPLKAQSICTVKNAYKGMVILCIFMAAFQSLNVLQLDFYYVRDPCTRESKPLLLPSTIMRSSVLYKALYVNALDYIVNFIIPAGSMFYMNHYLVKTLRSAITSGIGNNTDRREKQSASLTRRVLVVAICFVIIELPAFLANLVHLVCSELGAEKVVLQYTSAITINLYVLSTLNSVINFYVYCLTGKSFRKSLLRMFRRSFGDGLTAGSTTGSTALTD